VKEMNDLEKYIDQQKEIDLDFAKNFEEGYQKFKIGILLKNSRKKAGLTQSQLARMINTKKTSISRIENHAIDIKLSTLIKIATALNINFEIKFGDTQINL
jgi:DNA-binding XRE family transcriptional regulator